MTEIERTPLETTFFDRDADTVAQALIGTYLDFECEGRVTGGQIIETEAYDENDLASHCYRKPSQPIPIGSSPMFLAGGHAYIYPVSGRQYCLNFVCDRKDFGSAVLIRKIKPSINIDGMLLRYPNRQLLCAGPARLCSALGVTCEHNNLSLFAKPFRLYAREGELHERAIKPAPRVKIEKIVSRRNTSPELKKMTIEALRNWSLTAA